MTAETNRLPRWTWIASLAILHLGSEISVLLRYDQGVSAFYLPTALSVVLIHWWGPRIVLPAVFVNATLSTSLWGVERIYLWPVYAFSDVIIAFLSWYLFSYKTKGKFWIPDIRSLLLFLALGIVVPVVVEILYLEAVQIYFEDQPANQFINYTTINLLSGFASNFAISLPILYYLTPSMQSKGLLSRNVDIDKPTSVNRKEYIEVVLSYLLLLALTFVLAFDRYWFIYCLFSLYAAIRFGFGQAILMNGYIFLVTYLIPLLVRTNLQTDLEVDMNFTFMHIGTDLLYVFSAITGRVISDLRNIEERLTTQNKELELTNKELDRFVYSVSHDLSAPLKSILGLVNISRLSKDQQEQHEYIGKIENSVTKLESFIKEILDYSRDKRQDLVVEQIHLKELCTEILENLRFMDGYHKIHMNTEDFGEVKIQNDRNRLKIIFNNLLANAILYQKKIPDHKPFIKISSRQMDELVVVEIQDNGEGIKSNHQQRIFDMFFKGTVNSKGSGLGLYIAKEAAAKIDSRIWVRSEYGIGTTFTIEIKNLELN